MIRYVYSRTLADKIESAKYIFEANKEFYNIFGRSEDASYVLLSEMISDERTEEYNSRSIFLSDEMIGAISFYDASEIYYRQIFSLGYLKGPNVDSEVISNFSKGVPNIELNSLYLSRIAVSEIHRGKGYSTPILKYLESHAREANYENISLHVHSENQQAISVYKKYGFVISDDQSDYFIMLKTL